MAEGRRKGKREGRRRWWERKKTCSDLPPNYLAVHLDRWAGIRRTFLVSMAMISGEGIVIMVSFFFFLAEAVENIV
jgi:hypothetical protein